MNLFDIGNVTNAALIDSKRNPKLGVTNQLPQIKSASITRNNSETKMNDEVNKANTDPGYDLLLSNPNL